MKRMFIRVAWIATFALAVAMAAGPASADDKTTQFSLSIGGQSTSVSGERDSKFEEYRDVPNGAVVEDLFLRWLTQDGVWSLDLTGDHLGRLDEEAALRWQQAGRFKFDASWNRTPHSIANGATSLWNQSRPGVLEIPDSLQNRLESFVTSTVPPTTAQARAFVNDILASDGHKIDLKTRRDVAAARFALDATEAWQLGLWGRNQETQGTSRIGTGTYIRRQAIAGVPGTGANNFDRERIEPRTAELPLPIDWQAQEGGLDSGYRFARGFVDFGWMQSRFENRITSLTWDNPFEGAPGASSSPSGLNPGSEQEPAGANTNNRGRFPSAQLDLFPSNDFESAHASVGYDLPGRTRVTAAYSSQSFKQNDPFLAYTQNAAVLFSNGPDGKAGTSDDVLAKDVALPRGSLDGKVKTSRVDLKVASRPIDAVSVRATYRDYDYRNDTPKIVLPGFSAAGDAYFRPGIGQRDATGTRVLFNEPGGYRRTIWSAGGAYKLGKPATLDVEYTSTALEYDERQVEKTNESQIVARLRVAVGDRFEARLSALDSSRDAEGTYDVGFETSRLRAFDVWNRDRKRYGAELTWTIGEQSAFGLTYQNAKDDYPGVLPQPSPASASNPFASFPYGLNATRNDSFAATFSTGRDRWSLSASAGLDDSKWESLATSKTSLTSDSIQFDPTNRWRRTQDDRVRWGSLAFDTELGTKGKLHAEADYQSYDGDLRTVNLATPNINSGVAYSVPGFSSRLFSGKVSYDWALRENLDLSFGYWYEPYRLDDWQWDLVEPYGQGVLQETGSSPTTVRDQTALRTLFLDATYSDYTANVFSVFAKLRY